LEILNFWNLKNCSKTYFSNFYKCSPFEKLEGFFIYTLNLGVQICFSIFKFQEFDKLLKINFFQNLYVGFFPFNKFKEFNSMQKKVSSPGFCLLRPGKCVLAEGTQLKTMNQ
jgi:hypothetical protein